MFISQSKDKHKGQIIEKDMENVIKKSCEREKIVDLKYMGN